MSEATSKCGGRRQGSDMGEHTRSPLALQLEALRPASSPLEAWKSTPLRIEALLSSMRADGFAARLFSSSSADMLGTPVSLYLELGVPESELIDDAEALQMTKRCKGIWGVPF
ncbi:hypothetical protein T492DRAFT_838297 [Pavlovales sp. CCMP2436]|nr:hypothetical protein T492DRAFT_838297 [Pavlovales sp. CCMP2436]